MQGKKEETASNKNPKKANLLDHNSIKHVLDESVTEIVSSKGYPEDVRMSNIRLLLGLIIIVIALFAQFYNKKFPKNRNFLISCIALYVVFNGILQLILYLKEKNAILFTYPPPDRTFIFGNLVVFTSWLFCISTPVLWKPNHFSNWEEDSFNLTGLVVTSKLPRFSDLYTLIIASADPNSISAKPQVEFTRSVIRWFTKDGVLVEGLFWKDVEGLINEYAKESKKSK